MTREEAIGYLRVIITYAENDGYTELTIEALKMAIKSLEQESVLDKIKAEIVAERDTWDKWEQADCYYSYDKCLDIIDKYTAENEEGAEK